jgi:predicted Kef-type K+ transport protein
MHQQDFFHNAMIYLLAAVISVPVAKRLGFGSVLGYLLAGMVIGPFVLGLIGSEGKDVMYFAEFGVVMMLFLIGLELKPNLLWQMRKSIFGLGGLQLLISSVLIGGIALLLGQTLGAGVAIGLMLGLSSTAIVLQTLNEKGLIKQASGQASFSVLLFQDISVVPILALIPLLGARAVSGVASSYEEVRTIAGNRNPGMGPGGHDAGGYHRHCGGGTIPGQICLQDHCPYRFAGNIYSHGPAPGHRHFPAYGPGGTVARPGRFSCRNRAGQ